MRTPSAAPSRLAWASAALALVISLLVAPFAQADSVDGNNSITTPFGTAASLSPAVAIGPDGNPVMVAMTDATAWTWSLIVCSNPECSGSQTVHPLPTNPLTMSATYLDLTLDASGNPVIAAVLREPATMNKLYVLHCTNATCTGPEFWVGFPTFSTNLYEVRLELTSTGNPVMLAEGQDDTARLVVCSNATCTGGVTYTTLTLIKGTQVLTLDSSDRPVIAHLYPDFLDADSLRLLHCSNSVCSGDQSANNATVVPATDWIFAPSVQLDAAGNPVIAYADDGDDSLKLIHCTNSGCTGSQTVRLVAAGKVPYVNDAPRTDMFVDRDGKPVIAFQDTTSAFDLYVARCADAACSSASVVPADTAGDVGFDLHMAADPDDNPAIVYASRVDLGATYDFDVKFLHCYDTAICAATGTDRDSDGIASGSDNCTGVANPGQANNDGDSRGDACDPDDDNDSVLDGADNCQMVANTDQRDTDADGSGDACDLTDIKAPASCALGSIMMNLIVGTNGNNVITATSSPDLIKGLGGSDRISSGAGNDCVIAGGGNDVIRSGPGNDRAFGGGGNDRLILGAGDDRGRGDAGKDVLKGQGGKDTLNGGGQNDRLDGGADSVPDRCLGGPGTDRARRCSVSIGIP